MSPNDLLGIAGIISLAIVLAGAWTMRQRVRSRATTIFFLSVLALALWSPVASLAVPVLFSYFGGEEISPWLNYSVMSVEVFAPALLLLVAASTFLLSIRAIPRPN